MSALVRFVGGTMDTETMLVAHVTGSITFPAIAGPYLETLGKWGYGLSEIETRIIKEAKEAAKPKRSRPGPRRPPVPSKTVVPTARIRRIEPIKGDEQRVAMMLRRALEERTGITPLPFDLEEEVTSVFAGLDPETGEVISDSPPDDQSGQDTDHA